MSLYNDEPIVKNEHANKLGLVVTEGRDGDGDMYNVWDRKGDMVGTGIIALELYLNRYERHK